ncbi:YihY/virulence factor BrkB family protein [Phyllobacterium endophyticum]|jgi:membrane protein|uniref:Ribonuclease BN n=1 Tax=Phyllobacterium endophyticum TaxID=1149773 RepID=A0A2P7ALD6_9HYPH|nr:YihY/virulence factor BrkB family protein [Phyllobacterium endophyticum]MBB3236456.1 membrane protein [Phyllobacterium endophyticum]PSH55023.1 ribonuclease BN [Phyllobacterium endophyticum]TXR48460.1 YihY/virulence factor BrkB family protein [Phyllobacterium endophyticum]TYR39980.1 YihY/virulence factor BrkB family protein [Phyllobacterium endophyticum]
MRRAKSFLRRVIADTWRHFSTDDGWALASHVALSGIMALFPFLIFATSLASFLGASAFTDTAVHVIFDTWPEVIAKPIAQEVRNVLNIQRGGLLTISVIAAAYFASNGIEALRVALNRAYRVIDTRSIIYCRLQSLGYVVVATIGIMAISFLLILAPLAMRIATIYIPELVLISATIGFWRYCIASAVLIIGLLVVHLWLPAGHRTFMEILPGVLVTLLAWTIGATIFASYLETFANYVSTYAGLASIMAAIVFLYIIAAIFIIGAEINAAIIRYWESVEAERA